MCYFRPIYCLFLSLQNWDKIAFGHLISFGVSILFLSAGFIKIFFEINFERNDSDKNYRDRKSCIEISWRDMQYSSR
jgi:hypothetical protein